MKNINIKVITGLISAIMFFTSCEKYLDIEPQQSISAEIVYSSHEGVINALYGAYSISSAATLYAGSSVYFSDLLGNTEDIEWIGTFLEWREMNWKEIDPNNNFVTTTWRDAYRIINITNNVLASIDMVNENERDRISGEASFLRGIMYFELVRFYALPYGFTGDNSHAGVPLVITPTTGIDDSSYPSRATVGAVYNQIIGDLTNAKGKLAVSGPGGNSGRATGTNASAFLARVYLSMKEWENAATEANNVISVSGFSLNNTPREAFNNDGYTTEDVFMIRQNSTSHAGQANAGLATHFASLMGLGRGDLFATEEYFERFEPADLRSQITDDPTIITIADVETMFYIGVDSDPGNPMTSKWGKHDAFINVIRLAEMILTRAEANYMKGGSPVGGVEPYQDLNTIRARANATLLTGASEVDLGAIQDERIRELSFEGHMLHDVKRWGGNVVAPTGSSHSGQTIQWNDDRLVLPIPQREIDVNENLVQNPGY